MLTMQQMLTPMQVATKLNVSRATVYRWAAVGLLPEPFRRGRTIRFDPAKIEHLIQMQSQR